MRPKVYIDTSVISGLFAEDELWIREATKTFFKKVAQGKLEVFISEEVDREIRATPDEEKRRFLIEALASYELKRVQRTEECDNLANRYIEKKIFPKRYRGDALHVAITVIYALEAIVSWNFQHIVRHSTRIKVNK